jgi:glycosyltransferase involved in cell wall biosynthesis
MIIHEKIVIVIPVYNEGVYILRALKSVFNQTYSNYYVLISDNCSTDETKDICTDFCSQDHRFNYFCQESNLGAARNFEFCLKYTKSEYVVFLGGHDVLAPDFLEMALNEAEANPDVSLVYGHTKWIDEEDNVITITNGGNYIFKEPLDAASRYLKMLYALNRCEAINQLIRRKYLDLNNFSSVISADLVWMCHLAAHGPYFRIEKPLYYRREFKKRHSTAMERISGDKNSKADYHKLSWLFFEDIKEHKAIGEENKIKLLAGVIEWLNNRFNVFSLELPGNYPVKFSSNIDLELNVKFPRFSVIIPAFNREKYIEKSVLSVLDQDFCDFEIIVVDDGSSDTTVKLVNSITDKRIRLFQMSHMGGPGARNVGIKNAVGDFIVWLDSDDVLASGALNAISNTIDLYPDADIFYGDLLIFDDDFPKRNLKTKYPDFYKIGSILPNLIKGNCLPNPGTAVRRSLFAKYGGFDSRFKRCHDYQMWSRLADVAVFKKVDTIVCHWRQHGDSLSAKGERIYESMVAQDMYDRYPYFRLFPECANSLDGEKIALQAMAKILTSLGDQVAANEYKAKADKVEVVSLPELDTTTPLVSIILPTCNRPNLLMDALASIKNQTYKHWEVVVINEGEEDIADLLVTILEDDCYRYIDHRSSFGLSAARNSGLRLSNGQLICFLDDDDLFLPHHLEVVVNQMLKENSTVIYTDAEIVDETIDGEQRIIKNRANPYTHDHFSLAKLCIQNYIPVNTWVCRWECIQRVGLFDETLKSFEDWDLLLRLARFYEFVHVPQTTVEVRRRADKNDHMTDRERHTFPQLYRKIYERTRDLENEAICAQRQKYLDRLEGKAVVHTLNIPRARDVPRIVDPYKAWKKKHSLVEADGQLLAERMHSWNVSPNFLILTVFESTNTALLADTIDSLTRQFYNQWSLAIVSALPSPDPLFDEMEMVHWLQVEDDPYQAINQVLANVDAFDWVAVIPPGAVFSENALSVFSNYINKKPEWCFIYSDEDSIDDKGTYVNPHFKPDLNLDLLRSMPYFGDACFVRKSVIDEFNGFCGLAGVLNWDLGFKIFERLGKSVIGHVSEVLLHKPISTISDIENKYLVAAEQLTLQRHFERLGVQVAVAEGLVDHTYFVEYPLTSQPLVSVVLTLLSKEQLNRLSECIQAIFINTEYSDYEIVITSKLLESEVRPIIDKLEVGSINVAHIEYQGNLISPLNNKSLNELNGDYILLFNPDLLVLHNYWLETLMAQAMRNEVGVVGARIVDKNKQIHHAGIVLGMGDFGVADYPNRHLPVSDPGYMNRAVVTQNFSAVSTQCFLVKKALLVDCLEIEINVFDHIDFCLQVAQRGFSVVWTPFVTLMLTEQTLQQRTMDQLRQDADQMIEKWLPQLANDPAYNRNLSLKHRHFQIETETDVTWNIDFHDRPRVYAFPANESGIGEYRVRAPLRALTHAAMIESSLLPNHSATLIPDIVEIERVKPDTLLLQNGTADYLIHAWQQYRKFNDVFMIYSQDDLVHMLPGKHPLQSKWPKDVRRRLSQLMSHSDRLIVATEPLQEAYSKYISDIKLVPNYLETARWLGLKSNKQMRNGKKLRVGWAGGGQHHGDLEFIVPVIEATKDEVDWIFMGMCLDQIRPYIKEYHAGVAFDLYPQKLADLDLDLAVAPLEYNNFNMAKTNLRLLEYGVLGWPVLCSDITPYRNAPVTLVGNNVNHWIKAIREKIHEPDALVKEGQALQQWVLDNYLLEDHLDEWLAALTS